MTFSLCQLVSVRMQDGSTPLGFIRSHEPGENLGTRYGKPIAGTAYTVELVGYDGEPGETVVVGEDRVERLDA